MGFILTDQRLVFLNPAGDKSVCSSLEYGDIADLNGDAESGPVVAATTTEDVTWRFALPTANPQVVDAVARHLRWVGEVRRRVRAFADEMDSIARDIRDAAQAGNWEEATDRYERARNRLDHLTCAVQFTEPIDDQVLAPELSVLERKLEGAHVRLFVERAKADLETANALIAEEDYDRAMSVLSRARNLARLAGDQRDAVKRSDAFQFGTQRELEDAIQRLEWTVDTVAAEPLRLAVDARIRAQQAESRQLALEHWEAAFVRFGKLQRLELAETPMVDERAKIEAGREIAGEQLSRLYETLGREKWIEAAQADLNSHSVAAVEAYERAEEYLTGAAAMAKEYREAGMDFDPAQANLDRILASLQNGNITPTKSAIRRRIDAKLGVGSATDDPCENSLPAEANIGPASTGVRAAIDD